MPPERQSARTEVRAPAVVVHDDLTTPDGSDATFHARLSADLDRATVQLEACADEPCRRAWSAVLEELEQMLPVDVGEPVR